MVHRPEQHMLRRCIIKRPISPNIDKKRCNAYSGMAHMYAAISLENSSVIVTIIEDTTDKPAETVFSGFALASNNEYI